MTDGLPPQSVVTTARSKVVVNPRPGTEVAGPTLGLCSLTSFPIFPGGYILSPHA